MNELSKITKTENLPVEFKATFSAMVSKSELKDVNNYVVTGIAQSYAITGFKSNLTQEQYEKELMFLSGSVSELIIKKVPLLRIEEIPIAFKNGSLGEYGPFQGLSVVTFIFFAQSYYSSENRSKMILANRIKDEKPVPSPEEVLEGIKKLIVKAYQTFIEKGFYDDYGNFIYNKMDELGLISLTPARKSEIYNQAQVSVRNKKDPQNAVNLQEFKDFSSTLELINNPDSESGKNIIKTEAKKIALQQVFKDFLGMEADINELVNQTQDF